MSSIEDVAADLLQAQTELPIRELATAIASLQGAAGQLTAITEGSAKREEIAEWLTPATDSAQQALEYLTTSHGLITAYLGEIGMGSAVNQGLGDRQAPPKPTAEEETLSAYQALLAKLEDAATFDEEQSTLCLNAVTQNLRDLIRTGQIPEVFALRQKTQKTYIKLPTVRYSRAVGHGEAWEEALAQNAIDLATVAQAHPNTALSYEIIDALLGNTGALPVKKPGFSEFVLEHLLESMERTNAAVDTRFVQTTADLTDHANLTSEEADTLLQAYIVKEVDKEKLSSRYAYVAETLIGYSHALKTRTKAAHTIVALNHWNLPGKTDSYRWFADEVLDKVIHQSSYRLLEAFGLSPVALDSAWTYANGGYKQRGSTSVISREKYVRRNIRHICELETEHPGSARYLQKTLGIYNFGRHELKLLLDAYELCSGNGQALSTEPIAVTVSFPEDHNGAFIAKSSKHVNLHLQLRKGGAQLLPVEVQWAEDMIGIRDHLKKLGMKRASVLIVDAHGQTHSIESGRYSSITSQDVRQGLGAFIRSVVDKNGTVVLYGCSNGKEAEGFAQIVADCSGRNVIASPDDLALKNITATVEPDGKINPTVVFVNLDTDEEVAPVHFKPRRIDHTKK